MTHELSNPLNSMVLRLQLMQKQTRHTVLSEEREQLQNPSMFAKKKLISWMDGIITIFLQAIRSQKLILLPTNIEIVIDRVLNVLSPELVNGHITVSKKFSALPPILADEKQLEEAFFNIKKMPWKCCQIAVIFLLAAS
jgi:signal transduction histidine kinase